MKIQIFGTGCAKCNKLTELTKQAADDLCIDYELEKVTDMLKFADYGVMITPAMAVDGQVRVSGRLPAIDELKEMLS